MTSKPPIAVVDSDDPWIAGYLKLRQAVVTGELQTREDIGRLRGRATA